MFAVSSDEVASIVGRSSEAARQLASRARRRVQGASAVLKASVMEQRRVVDAFLDALRRGVLEGLVAVLDPDIVVRVDEAAASLLRVDATNDEISQAGRKSFRRDAPAPAYARPQK